MKFRAQVSLEHTQTCPEVKAVTRQLILRLLAWLPGGRLSHPELNRRRLKPP